MINSGIPSFVETAAGSRRLKPTTTRFRRFGVRLLLTVVPVFLVSSMLTFLLGVIAAAKTSPGAVMLGERATPEDIARIDEGLGLNRPLPTRYFTWLGDALRGDLGESYFGRLSVSSSIANRLPVTLSVATLALLFAALIGTTTGIVSGTRPGGRTDRILMGAMSVILTLPEFVIGVTLMVVFAVHWELLPATGYVPASERVGEWFRHLLLPALALSLNAAADVSRQLRTSLVAVFRENFVVGAVVRGFSFRRILFRHALRQAASPAVTTLGLHAPRILGGAVVVETLFALPGLGPYALQGALVGDTPVVQGVLFVSIVIVLIVNIGTNFLLEWLRPEATV